MTHVFIATNRHASALLALIRAIRACPTCIPQLYLTCAAHRAELDRIYPMQCPDPECPACAGQHDTATFGDQPPPTAPPAACPACGSTDPARRGHPAGYRCDDPSRFHAAHDNGDYHGPK